MTGEITQQVHEDFRQAIVEALELTYGLPDHGGTRYPTDEEIVSWVGTERRRVMTMHRAHHSQLPNGEPCPKCGIYGGPSSRATS